MQWNTSVYQTNIHLQQRLTNHDGQILLDLVSRQVVLGGGGGGKQKGCLHSAQSDLEIPLRKRKDCVAWRNTYVMKKLTRKYVAW